ncbi:EXPERA domain-containing protein [Nannocystis bainbridge]|uniref:Emopamil-binding family protein n=1 Tax=Nannocystis bainbridge TaxID=2995303 RepID=A0ABT5DQ23_9BACT|nr:emopamil-binding family protein [Nannocystis bainbridge]MDC0715755.1 emopamil-binding family protein [Nannocystis bainbridge]
MADVTGHEGHVQVRWIDRVLLVFALSFCSTSLLFDRMAALEPGPMAPATEGLRGFFYWWGSTYDPLIVLNPLWLQIASCVSAFVFGPFYAVLAVALVRRREWIRWPAIIYASVMLYSMVIFLGVHTFGEPRPTVPWLVALLYAPYVLFPLALLRRMLPRRGPAGEVRPLFETGRG